MSVRSHARTLTIFALAFVLLLAGRAWAAISDLEVRTAKFSWDKANVLHATFAFRDAIDDKAIAKKLTSGLKVRLVMRTIVYANAGGDSVAVNGLTCEIGYELWDEVFIVTVNGVKKPPALKNGVYRLCTDMTDFSVAERPLLKGGPAGYLLTVKVEVNPVSEDTLKKVQQWVTRPTGASFGISPGDALFASFVGVFMKKIEKADKVVEFRTASFPP